MINESKTRTGAGAGQTRRMLKYSRRFIRDERRSSTSHDSGVFWSRIWRNLRAA